MDRAFRNIVTMFGMSIPEAATMCSTTPARALGLTRFGVVAEGNIADLVVLDRAFRVVRTFIAGEQVYGERRASTDFTLLWREPMGRKRAGKTRSTCESELKLPDRLNGVTRGIIDPRLLNASRRSRHLLHTPQCRPPRGFIQDNVPSSGTPSSTPSLITSDFSFSTKGASMLSSCARPSDIACAIA
jgi:hypothetical protein